MRDVKRALTRMRRRIGRSDHRMVDFFTFLVALLLLVAMGSLVSEPTLQEWEIQSFRVINQLPDFLFYVIWPFMQYGVFVTIPMASAIAFYYKKYRLATLLLVGGIGIYFLARFIKEAIPRGRPNDILDGVIMREQFAPGSKGFTSGHTAVAATIATFVHYYLSRNWRIVSIVTLGIVAFGRVYIGAHMPLDVFGGVALGVAVASLINFVVGVPHSRPAPVETSEVWITQHRPRHPGDLIRMFIGLMVFIITTIFALSGSVSLLEEAAFHVINYLPSFLSPVLQLIMQMGALFFVFVAASIALMFKHVRLSIKLLFGGVGVWWVVKIAKELVGRERPSYLLEQIVEKASNTGLLGFPSGHAAVAALIATVSAPYVSKNWGRLFWFCAIVTGTSRVYVGAHLPLDIFAGLALGWFFGSLLNFIFGTPARTVPLQKIMSVMNESGLSIVRLEHAEVDARGSIPLIAHTKSNKKYFVKQLDNEHRNADILYRLWRYMTRRNIEDEAPFVTTKHLAEHEAYLAMQAQNAGVSAPKVLLAAPVNSSRSIVVTELLTATALDDYVGILPKSVLMDVWSNVAKLHKNRIAHRDLRAANIMIDKNNKIWIIDFSFSQTAASQSRLAIDVVELLVSLSEHSKPADVVSAAIRQLGTERVAEIYPFMQPVSLSTASRRILHNNPRLLDNLKKEIRKQTKVKPSEPAKIMRFNSKWIIFLIFAAFATFYLLPKLSDLDDSLLAVRHIDYPWLFVALIFSLMTYVFSAFVVLGASSRSLSFGQVFMLQIANSFVNRITPRGLGSIALTERFLESSGLKRAEAVATISLVYAAGVLMHTILTITSIIFFAPDNISLLDFKIYHGLPAAVIVLFLGLGLLLFPRIKYFVVRVFESLLESLRHGLSHSVKFMQLLGGSVAVTLSYTIALYATIEGFGHQILFTEVLFVYLAGSVIASASPTPGGLGAAEAALIIGLSAVGLDTGQAVVSVLAFRAVTFWLPILPGFIMFRRFSKLFLVK